MGLFKVFGWALIFTTKSYTSSHHLKLQGAPGSYPRCFTRRSSTHCGRWSRVYDHKYSFRQGRLFQSLHVFALIYWWSVEIERDGCWTLQQILLCHPTRNEFLFYLPHSWRHVTSRSQGLFPASRGAPSKRPWVGGWRGHEGRKLGWNWAPPFYVN